LSLRHRLTVAEVVRETPDVVSVRVTGRDLESLHADAGQYFRWRFLASRQWQAAHPYSLSRPPEPDSMRITVKAVGRHSSRVAALRPGTRVIAEGPCGGFTAARRSRTNVLLIAGGVGITPLRSLFESLCPAGGTITLLYRVGARAEVLFDDELQAIAEQTGKEVSLLLGHRADLGYDPLASGMLVRHIPDLRHRDIYLCGPRGMAHTVRNELRTEGVARRHLFTESFGL
jgi:ferredoxin-NADP reductase